MRRLTFALTAFVCISAAASAQTAPTKVAAKAPAVAGCTEWRVYRSDVPTGYIGVQVRYEGVTLDDLKKCNPPSPNGRVKAVVGVPYNDSGIAKVAYIVDFAQNGKAGSVLALPEGVDVASFVSRPKDGTPFIGQLPTGEGYKRDDEGRGIVVLNPPPAAMMRTK